MSETGVLRTTVRIDGDMASYLTVEQDGPAVLLLHGTYWSRVWLAVLDRLAAAGLRPIAVDFPGLGRSGGELTPETATVPALADWVTRFASTLQLPEPIAVAGHDIGGAVAQHLLAHDLLKVRRLALVNSVAYDSWPAPHVARFRDPAVVAATTTDDLLAARRRAATTDLADAATDQRIAEYLAPWTDPRVRRSWLAMVTAADPRYTLALVPALQQSPTPKLLIWGEDDRFEKIEYAERFAAEIPHTTLVRIPNAAHIPTENAPTQVAHALTEFCTT
ncbi:alpha/beta fold hydrolase [Nocardia terpenica]|uniref:alpha/beta fold hydrolase n=1 Tax=Nocardia terpenica TaxID=455432 RepID=UPI0018955FA9|nr:alpha/beta hydrolase [Nocardia terpenica]MBF6065809.1 alpha/beta fold hydrolase [Nocardia terpenica]MBF6108428.1 alpha/beta fold hydrolase [Nocardia terpenica]MBF6115924.1 alpha/beta fold hydrolase [Nocardia terpenica]MBF6123054.1 alpha/beta fold hydrolase [Nocardia terpenica]MBF6156272.1 alpha/beta fold hydrolase [Nocardia terpenica]